MKNSKTKKQILSIILSIMMIVSMFPVVSVHAHAWDDTSWVKLSQNGTEVSKLTELVDTSHKIMVYEITENGDYTLTTSEFNDYAVTIMLSEGTTDVNLTLDNVNISTTNPYLSAGQASPYYTNGVYGGLVVAVAGDGTTDTTVRNLNVALNGQNFVQVYGDFSGNSISAIAFRGCNTVIYSAAEGATLFASNTSSGSQNNYGILNIGVDYNFENNGSCEWVTDIAFSDNAEVVVEAPNGYGVVTSRRFILECGANLNINCRETALHSRSDERINDEAMNAVYLNNAHLSINSEGAGIVADNGDIVIDSDTGLDSHSVENGIYSGNGDVYITNAGNALINSTNGYGVYFGVDNSTLSLNSGNVEIYGNSGAVASEGEYVIERGYSDGKEVVTYHFDNGEDPVAFTDAQTSKAYLQASLDEHTCSFEGDYVYSEEDESHYRYCACGESSEPEKCTWEFYCWSEVPSAETDGKKIYRCSVCGTDKEIIVLKHDCSDYTTFEESDEEGYHSGLCSFEDCGRNVVEQHTFGEYEDYTDALHRRQCTVCFAYEENEHYANKSLTNLGDNGHQIVCDDCGHTETDSHDYIEYSGNNDGLTHTGSCECGATVTEDHSWGEWIETDNGYMRSCDGCGAADYCSHEWSGWSYDDVMHSRQCTICPAVEENEHYSEAGFIDMGIGHYMICDECENQISLPHEYEKCGDNGDGTHTKHCFCGATVTEGHNWGDWEEAADGLGHIRECTDCSVEERGEHQYGEWYGISDLHHQHQCDLCGSLEDGRHTWGDWTDLGAEHSHECSSCGWKITEEHSFSEFIDDENGETHTSYCACGLEDTLPHDWGDWVMAEDGSGYMHSCNSCGAVEYCQHSWGDWTSVDEANHRRECEICGDYEENPHTLGDWVNAGEEGHKLACSDCDYAIVEPHEIHENIPDENGETHTGYCWCNAVVTKPHTWGKGEETEDGHVRLCTGCSTTKVEPHSWTDWSAENAETHHRSCTGCDAYQSEPHDYDRHEEYDESFHKSYCSVCNNEMEFTHEFGELVDDKNGKTHSQTCDCGKVITEDHKFDFSNGSNDPDYHYGYCECGATVTEEHDWSDWVESDSGHIRSCLGCFATQEGTHNYGNFVADDNTHTGECLDCHATISGEHSFKSHEYVDDKKHQSTCEICEHKVIKEHNTVEHYDLGDGTHKGYCNDCLVSVFEEHTIKSVYFDSNTHESKCEKCEFTEQVEHNWSEWKSRDDDFHYRECLGCGFEEEFNHTLGDWSNYDDKTHRLSCAVCDYYKSGNHEFVDYVDDGNGLTHTAECWCGATHTTNHSFNGEWIDDENGLTHSKYCECNATQTTDHDWSDWTSVNEYIHRRECSGCGAYETGSHSLGSVETHNETNHKYTCSTCEYFETENHNFEFVSDDLNGETHTEKCMCGEMHSVAHDYTSHVGDIGDGINHNAYCECGAYTAEEHVYNTEFSDAGDGTHYVHCLCGAYTMQEHTYDQVIVTREPVDGMPGEKQYTCQCGATSYSTEFISYIDINDDGVIDVEDYQFIVNEALSDGNEQSGTAEYDEIIKYDLDGDGYVDVLDCALMALIVNGHKTFGEVQNTQKGDYDLDGEAYTESDLIAMNHVLSDIEGSAPTLSTSQKFASDLNCNGKIDEDDLTILVETYGTIEATTCEENIKVYYRWGNSYTTCTATAMCTLCNKKVAVETVDSVLNADGSYTATFTNTLLGTKTFKKQ